MFFSLSAALWFLVSVCSIASVSLTMTTTQEIRELLDLQPHPEGGFFAESFRDSDIFLSKSSLPESFKVGRPVSTAIYFLMPSGNVSNLHRIPSSEVWHFYAGEPLTVYSIDDDGNETHTVLGQDLGSGQKVMYAQKPNVWFGAYPTKDIQCVPEAGKPVVKSAVRNPDKYYSLVGCTVAPGFEYQDFELGTRSELSAKFPHAKAFIELLTQEAQ